jgi:hypothetical protein
MIFMTKLNGPATCNTAQQGVDAAYGISDSISRLGAAAEALNPPKRPLSCAYKARRRSPLWLKYLFLYVKLMYPPSLLFRNLFIPSYK